MPDNNEVVLVGRAELDQIMKSLKKFRDQADRATKGIGELGKKTNEGLEKTSKKAEDNIKKTGSVLRRLASSLYSDFKALMSLNSLQGALSISNKFKGTVSDSIDLSDSIRKVGNSFGIAQSQFAQFHGKLSKGLGEIGASSKSAARALEGVTGFGLKGEEATADMVKNVIMLASIGREKGNESGVGKAFGGAITSAGANPNDAKVRQAFAGEVSAAITTTGKTATEVLGAMSDIFGKMPNDLRKNVGPKAMAQLAAISTTGGPAATAAISKLLSLDKIHRMPLEAQGFHPFDKKGNLDLKSLMGFIKNVGNRTPGSRTALQTAGFSEEEAEGLVRLGEQSKRSAEVLEQLSGATRDVAKQFDSSKSLMENFDSSFDKVKTQLGSVFAPLTEKVNGALGAASKSNVGAIGVVGGSAIAAAMLGGGGMRGIMGMVGGEAKKKAFEAATGEKVQDVFVVNADQMGGGNNPLTGGGLGGMAGKAGLAGIAGVAGYELGDKVINPLLDKYTQGKNDSGIEGNIIERMFDKMTQMSMRGGKPAVTVHIQTIEKNLRGSDKPSKGAAN